MASVTPGGGEGTPVAETDGGESYLYDPARPR